LKDIIHSVLRKASPALAQLQDDWFIIGSSAMALSGIAIASTQDIDLLLSTRDALFLQEAWRNKRIKDYCPQQGDLFRSTFSRFGFGVLDIEVMGDLEVHRNGRWTPVRIRQYHTMPIDGLFVKVPTLEEQIRIFTLLGRDKDLQKAKWIEHSGLTKQST
jgi:hypothetical protein